MNLHKEDTREKDLAQKREELRRKRAEIEAKRVALEKEIKQEEQRALEEEAKREREREEMRRAEIVLPFIIVNLAIRLTLLRTGTKGKINTKGIAEITVI